MKEVRHLHEYVECQLLPWEIKFNHIYYGWEEGERWQNTGHWNWI